jgi:hypothetical protein
VTVQEFSVFLQKEIAIYQRDNTKVTSFIEVKSSKIGVKIEARIDGFISVGPDFVASISAEIRRKFDRYLQTSQPCVITLHMTFIGGKAISFAFIFACEDNDISLVYRIEHDLSDY